MRVEGTLGAEQYQTQILQEFIKHVPRATRKRPVLMQDGATSHTAASTQAWLKEKNVKVLGWWPANSPDANIIENVWAWMARYLKKRDCRTDDALWEAVKKAWEAVPMDFIGKKI